MKTQNKQRNKINSNIKAEKREKSLELNNSKQKLQGLIFYHSLSQIYSQLKTIVISNLKLKD